jgi:uncharacterized protein
MAVISDLNTLRKLYKSAHPRAVAKELGSLDAHCKQFIGLSPFVLIGSAGDPGDFGDVSPRGEDPGFVTVLDDKTLAIPDRPGNNRLDTLENILDNPEVGLLFLIPGVDETLRISGRAELRDDPELLERFRIRDRLPATVLVVTVRRAYLHCAKALMRSKLWDPDARIERSELPTMNQMIADQTAADGPIEDQHEMVKRYKDVLY